MMPVVIFLEIHCNFLCKIYIIDMVPFLSSFNCSIDS